MWGMGCRMPGLVQGFDLESSVGIGSIPGVGGLQGKVFGSIRGVGGLPRKHPRGWGAPG
jgi:hypothetical protein